MIAHFTTSALQIAGRRIIDEPAVPGKPRTVTGAVPAVLRRIPLQRAAQVGAAPDGRGQQVDDSLQRVERQLRAQDAPGGGKDAGVGAGPALHQFGEDLCSDHRGGHAPLLKAGGDVEVFGAGGIGADIGGAVQRHAVLRRKVIPLDGVGVIPRGKITQLLPAAAFFARAVAAAPYQQQVPVPAEGHSFF